MSVPPNGTVDGDDRLSRPEDWEAVSKSSEDAPFLTFDPRKPFFRDLHRFLMRRLPRDPAMRCLEIGCHPGTYMWYFHAHFGYRPSGIEYLSSGAERTRTYLARLGIEADVRHADLFEFAPGEQWDVVYSVGFVEHFRDMAGVIARHLDLVRPGGWLVLIIPNHSGFNGSVLRRLDPDLHEIHNCQDYAALRAGVEASGQATVVEGGYYGRLGFWNTGLYPWLQELGRVPYFVGRVVLYSIEHAAQWLMPNTAWLSPNCALVARKQG